MCYTLTSIHFRYHQHTVEPWQSGPFLLRFPSNPAKNLSLLDFPIDFHVKIPCIFRTLCNPNSVLFCQLVYMSQICCCSSKCDLTHVDILEMLDKIKNFALEHDDRVLMYTEEMKTLKEDTIMKKRLQMKQTTLHAFLNKK